VCGTNDELRRTLVARELGVALGWVDDLAPLMRACDVVVQNAGGLSSLEAMACGTPVLSYRCLPGHGQTNAAALATAGLADWPRDPADLATTLARLLDAPPAEVPALVTADPAAQLLSLVPATGPGVPATGPGVPATGPGVPASGPGVPARAGSVTRIGVAA
jgi:glycosyltransferase involved in cell wall biosynthesis